MSNLNRGFTLIELTAVIVVLAAIFLVSFPAFMNMSKADQDKQYSDMVKNLCLAGEAYIYANMDEYSELSIVDSQITITIEKLIQYGNVKKDIINIKTDETVNDDTLTFTVLNDYSLDCLYNDI